MSKSKDHKIVLIGHSLGAVMATHIAQEVYPRTIDLLVGYDCGIWNTLPLKDNVKSVLEFKGHTWVNPLSLRLLIPLKGRYYSYKRASRHIDFANDRSLHQLVYNTIVSITS